MAIIYITGAGEFACLSLKERMPFFSRVIRVSVLSGLALTLGAPVSGQSVTSAVIAGVRVDTAKWLYKGSDITPDPAWSFGTLPNGLRYAIRRNEAPPGQVSVRVRVDAGSLMEGEDERGFAHFIEHLSFRGSKYVPDGEAKRVWQRFGASFGSDTNAQTTPTQTTYKLDLPSATQASLDESLKILSGMMAHPVITDASITAERPVVLAEQREQPGPQVRAGDALRQLFFAGQPLADRSPIGNIKTLEAATGAKVSAFHDRWYRPDNTVVIISGDLDPQIMADGIVANFQDWRGTGPTPADPDFGKPDAGEPVSATIAEPGLPAVVTMAVLRPWVFHEDTIIFNQRRMVDMLASRLISRRLENRARAGGSFLEASVSLDDVSRSANLTSVSIVPVGDDWQAALKDVRAVIADAMATPPTQAEVDREYADFDTALRTQVETARVEGSGKQADDLGEALDIRETVAGPKTSYDILKDARTKGMFTPATLLASTRSIFEGTTTRALANTKVPEPGATNALAALLKVDVTGLAGKRRRQGNVNWSQLPKLGKPGTVTARTKLGGIDMERVDFANGTRLLLFPNQAEPGRVYVRVRFGRGYNALPADKQSPAWAGDLALVQGGIGKLDQGDIDQLTSGRRIDLDFGIDDDAFALAALTSPSDYADELRLMAAKLTDPRWDPAPVIRARAVVTASEAGYAQSPDGVLQRDLQGLLHDGDPRWSTPTRAQAETLTPARFKAFWAPLLASGPIEVTVFGDVNANEAISAVGRTFGAMKPRSEAASPAPPIRFPQHVTTPVMRTHQGPDNQAEAVIAWATDGGTADIVEDRRLEVLSQIFGDRLFERLRQAAGASYSPGVINQWPVGLPNGGRLYAVGKVTPDKVPFFFELARSIAADLVANPVSADELQRILGPIRQQVMRVSSANQFWMRQLGGAAYHPDRIEAARTIARDYAAVTPADLQATAARYLQPDRDWTMAVVPADKPAK